jgi:prepilin-type N-terminal cleavage/methylation domain-containing protein
MRRRSGFTLIELVVVVSIISLFTAMAVPNYVTYRRRAQTIEARLLLELIAHLEAVHRLEQGNYVACPPVPAEVPRGRAVPWTSTKEWESLGFAVDGATRYQVSVEVREGGFVAHARGDLDGNGRASDFQIGPQGVITEKDPLE